MAAGHTGPFNSKSIRTTVSDNRQNPVPSSSVRVSRRRGFHDPIRGTPNSNSMQCFDLPTKFQLLEGSAYRRPIFRYVKC